MPTTADNRLKGTVRAIEASLRPHEFDKREMARTCICGGMRDRIAA